MAAMQPSEIEPRMRRRSTFRVWSKEQEQGLLQCEQQLQSEVLAQKSKDRQLLELWEGLGYEGFTEQELSQKLSAIHRIHEMLKAKEAEGGTAAAKERGVRAGSLQADALWEEETLYMIKSGKTKDFGERLRKDRRASQVADARNRTALHHAASAGNLQLVEMLVGTDADLEAKDNDGRTPLFFALQHGMDQVSEWLLEKGACARIADNRGVTPLHLAAYTNSRRCTRQLLGVEGIDPNAADEKGATPLHLAAHRASVEVVEMLVKAGADPGAKDKRGNLPEVLAMRMEKPANEKALTGFRAGAKAVIATLRLQKALGGMGGVGKAPAADAAVEKKE